MRASEHFSAADAIKPLELPNLNHVVNNLHGDNKVTHAINSNTKSESAELVKSGVLPDVDFQDDKHPKKKSTGGGTDHGGTKGKIHLSPQDKKDLVDGGISLMPGGPLAKIVIRKLAPVVEQKIRENKNNHHKPEDKSHHSDKTKPKTDDPLHKFKKEGVGGAIHRGLDKLIHPKKKA